MSITAIVTAIVCLAVGGLIGAVITRKTLPDDSRRRELEGQLQRAEDELKNYQSDVTEHFIKTSALINNMTQSYSAVHEHMAASAMHLANPDISRQLLNAGTGQLNGPTQGDELLTEHTPEPPRDYAPKTSGAGVLSEEYGLNDEYGIEARPDHQFANDSDDEDDHTDPTLKAV